MFSNYCLIILFIVNKCLISEGRSFKNNACNNFQDYFNADTSRNCFYNSDMLLETPDLIAKHIGKPETYHVTTEDGYILTMFRIPRRNPKGVISLHNSGGLDSRTWVGQGNDSLAFYLWDAGYEIWLSNSRGTIFSQGHLSLSKSDLRYWNFSFHEVGFYDVSSQLKLIKEKSNNLKIIYIGHSQAASAALIYSSLKPQEANNIVSLFILMSTPCYFMHMSSPLRFFTSFEPLLQLSTNILQLSSSLLLSPVLKLSRILFRLFPAILSIMNFLFSTSMGWTPEETDPAVLNFDCAIYLKDFSWKTVAHVAQLIGAKTRFQMFDYGIHKNLQYYNSEVPPVYPLENMSAPLYFISSKNDSLTTLKDTDLLIKRINGTATILGHLKISGLNHLDYHFGRNKRRIYFEKLLKVVEYVTR